MCHSRFQFFLSVKGYITPFTIDPVKKLTKLFYKNITFSSLVTGHQSKSPYLGFLKEEIPQVSMYILLSKDRYIYYLQEFP